MGEMAKSLLYIPLPESVIKQIEDSWKQIQKVRECKIGVRGPNISVMLVQSAFCHRRSDTIACYCERPARFWFSPDVCHLLFGAKIGGCFMSKLKVFVVAAIGILTAAIVSTTAVAAGSISRAGATFPLPDLCQMGSCLSERQRDWPQLSVHRFGRRPSRRIKARTVTFGATRCAAEAGGPEQVRTGAVPDDHRPVSFR